MEQIAGALELVRGKLNAALKAVQPRADDWVILSNPVGQNGAAFEAARGKIVMTLIGITQVNVQTPPGGAANARLDLVLAFVANFENENYGKGLAAIERVIGFFHQTPVISGGVNPLQIQTENLSVADANGVLAAMGLRLLPCAFYRLHGVSL